MTTSRSNRKSVALDSSFDIEGMQRNADDATRLLRALANPQRLRILCLLVGGEMSVGQINARVDLSQSALSQHLAVLREEHLVNTRREAQTIHYALANGPAQAIIETLHGIYCSPKKSHGNSQTLCIS
jgi:DNA-binding transcriptional ArsR family regulator